jgi:signal transduction histidine kinase
MVDRLFAFDARRPWLLDGAIVLALIVATIATSDGLVSSSVLFGAAVSLPLLWRRRQPVAVFSIIAVVAFAQWLADVRTVGDFALLVALFTVALESPPRTTVAAAAVLEIGVILATVRWAVAEPLKVWIYLTGLTTAAAVLGAGARMHRELIGSLQERAARLEYERDQQGQLAAAAERARIAREMHDIVAHHLSVMISLADGARYQLDESPERAETALATLSQTGRQALTEMRRLLGVLRDERGPDLQPQPSLAVIDSLVARMREAGVSIRYELTGPTEDIEPGLQLTACRIVQEALTNALKHAGDDAQVSVAVACGAGAVTLEVRDTGRAVPGMEIDEGGGLRGMRERAAVYGGQVQAGPDPGGGWSVRTRLTPEAPAPALPA